MSSSRPDVVEDCLLEDLSQKPGSPYPTLDAVVTAFSMKYKHSMKCYAQYYDLHEESLLHMFSTQRRYSELADLHWFLEALSDEAKAAILKPYCDILGPVLDGNACAAQEKGARVEEQREKLI